MSIKLKITDRTDVEFPIIIKDEKGNIIEAEFSNGFQILKLKRVYNQTK